MSDEKPLQIVALEVENVKRIRAARIRPDGALVLIAGKNGAGKSSLLDAIAMALGGAEEIPAEPIRHGSRKAEIVVDLGELIVERSFSPKGTKLVVKSKEGVPLKSPQRILDELTQAVTFDPCSFTRMKPKEQDELLKRLLGLDFTELDQDREANYSARTEENRAIKALEARLDAMPEPEAGLPEKEVSAEEVLHALEELTALDREHEEQRRAVVVATALQGSHERELREIDHEIGALEQKIMRLRARAGEVVKERDLAAAEVRKAEALVAEHAPIDFDKPKKRLAELEQTNAKVRARIERDKLESELRAHTKKAEELTEAIDYIDQKKQEKLAAAKFPVAGLGFDSVGPTLDGVPLEQASQAQKLRVSVAIGAALNPRLKVVLIREGAFLDTDSLKLLAELAEEHGLQCWVERVAAGDPGAVIIEEGLVKGAAIAAAE